MEDFTGPHSGSRKLIHVSRQPILGEMERWDMFGVTDKAEINLTTAIPDRLEKMYCTC